MAALLALCIGAGTAMPVARAATTPAGLPAVANPRLLDALRASERGALARNGFFVVAPDQVRHDTNSPFSSPDPNHASYWQFYDLYHQNYVDQAPSFITSDAMLHTFHVIYDQTLVALERSVFVPKLLDLSSGLIQTATYQYGATTDPRLKEAARLNLGYLAVAARLLDPAAATPAAVAQPVARELALIAAHQGFAASPLFGYGVDYSKFIPRGHYAGDPTLSRYFQAMTWFGLLTFHLNGPDSALRTRQALLLVRGLTLVPRNLALWAALFDPITTWVGRSDDLTVRDYAGVMARVYKTAAPVGALANDAALARFIKLAKALPNPQINGDFVTSSNGAAQASKGLRLFGQRFVPDASIMQQLIWDKVGTAQQPRLWPLGLDVAAALGSQRATGLVTGPTSQGRYAHYTQRLASMQKTYVALPAQTWQQNLYWRSLDTMRAVWGPVPPAAPAFMKTGAWADKSLATGLGAWAELRHDTLLYVKQPTGLGGAGLISSLRAAYVEPEPLVYARLLALTQELKATLAAEGILDSLPTKVFSLSANYFQPPLPGGEHGYRAALDAFARMVALLQRVSERELLGQTVSGDDMTALVSIYNPLDLITTFFQNNGQAKELMPVDAQTAAIADVFTEPRSGQVLEVGVGDVLPLYAIVTINGQRWLARGGAYSYYEFHWPMSDRLTDNAWRHMARRPVLPSWTASYMR